MRRQAVIIKSSSDGKRNIAVDSGNCREIMEFLTRDKRHRNKFLDICNIILHGLRNTELYDKEDINERCQNVTAMKFFKGQENARLYCQEIRERNKEFVVVAVELLERKKNQKNKQKERNLIEKVANYEYEILHPEKD